VSGTTLPFFFFLLTLRSYLMKLKGKRPGVHIEPIPLPRPNGDLIFLAKAIEDFEPFTTLCPPPKPPTKTLPGGEIISNIEDKGFQQALTNYGNKRVAYMVIKGLEDGTPDLEWETVKLDDHTTWDKYTKELRESGLSDIEISRLVNGVMRANSLSEDAVEEARNRLLVSERDLDEN